jgi:hypothetical protein
MTWITHPIDAGVPDQSVAGAWRVLIKPRAQSVVDATVLRGLATKIGSFSFADPFGPKEMSFTFPGVSVFDRLGMGDLAFLRRGNDVDVVWDAPLPAGFHPLPAIPGAAGTQPWRWEGYIAAFERSNDGLTVQCKGALYQLDNWVAKPEYPARPLPYEWAIARQFVGKPTLRVHPLRIIWPSWWTTTYTPVAKASPYLIPAGVTSGAPWTGLLTRATGNWDPVLTSYIQGMLTAMYDQKGRWTIDLDAYRQPVLFHRDFVSFGIPAPGDINYPVTVDLADPGVKVSLSQDWEQSLTTVYAQGTSLSGIAFSGMNVSADGTQTTYTPMAYLRQAWPESDDNLWRDPDVMVREVMLQVQTGLNSDDATTVARSHLDRFADPGVTGSITLASDPKLNGVVVPRHLIRAGQYVHMPRALGARDGIVAHVVSTQADLAGGKMTLNIDSKFRDALTNDEVRLRGRDALAVSRMLVAGQYKPPVDDQMLPWSYDQGSGYIPSNATYSSLRLFKDMPASVAFPWTDWTTLRPPRDPKWASSYLHLGPASSNADNNWFVQSQPNGARMGVPIQMAQAGNVRLLQMVALNRDGEVLPVPFHISFFYVGGVNPASMPLIPAEQEKLFPPYKAGQHYPFVRDGWGAYNIDGTQTNPNIPHPTQSVGLIRAYGDFYQKAGYWPGAYSDGDQPTGLLVDESTWGFDTTKVDASYWTDYSVESNLTNVKSGKIYAMVYCDAQKTGDVYFVGRMFRQEPGQGGGASA